MRRLRLQFSGGDGLQDHADLRRVSARDHVAGQQHPLRPLRSDIVEPHVHRGRAHGARRRKSDPGIAGSDDHVAANGEVCATGDAVPLHSSDDRLVHLEDGEDVRLIALEAPGVVGDEMEPGWRYWLASKSFVAAGPETS